MDYLTDEERQLLLKLIRHRAVQLSGRLGGDEYTRLLVLQRKLEGVGQRVKSNTGVTDGPRRMLSEKQVLAIVPVGRSTLWRMEAAGKFPKATHVGTNRRVWFEDQLVAWQNSLAPLPKS